MNCFPSYYVLVYYVVSVLVIFCPIYWFSLYLNQKSRISQYSSCRLRDGGEIAECRASFVLSKSKALLVAPLILLLVSSVILWGLSCKSANGQGIYDIIVLSIIIFVAILSMADYYLAAITVCDDMLYVRTLNTLFREIQFKLDGSVACYYRRDPISSRVYIFMIIYKKKSFFVMNISNEKELASLLNSME